jgi:hypothetical protein
MIYVLIIGFFEMFLGLAEGLDCSRLAWAILAILVGE